jgi:gentisate 1,2-dioxygenase
MQVSESRPNDLTQQREALYKHLESQNIEALWRALDAVTPRTPVAQSVPHIWRWRDMKPMLSKACDVVTPQEAERRVLMLINPAYPAKTLRTVGLLYAGIQMIRPGETADAHRHSPNAQRFIIAGEGVYMNVDGETAMAAKGDFVLTPSWCWHDHGNRSGQDMVWLDGLDIAFANILDANFFEDWEGPGHSPPVTVAEGDSHRRWGRHMRPTWQEPERPGRASMLLYAWGESRDALHALRHDQGSPYDGIIMQYCDPRDGGPTMPTFASSLQLLRKDEHTRAHRHTSSTIYHVAEGGGRSIIGGAEFAWEEGDTFVLPSWTWHEHESVGGDAVLFSYTDRPVIETFRWYREEEHPDVYQS